MYHARENLIFGFHGCDESLRDALVSGKKAMHISNNAYDWLGTGMYFWENDYERALRWAKDAKAHPQNKKQKIENPSVVGAVLSLGNCLDLMSIDNLALLKSAYEMLRADGRTELPQNDEKTLKRNLDCAVINYFVALQRKMGCSYDSVRAVFFEGKELYPTAGFREKNHIQISVINPDCIKGFFIPREPTKD